jgi:outer membrane protein OmpA-like peptidoglycan-associated protein
MLGCSPLAVYHVTPNAAVLAGPTVGWIPSNNYNERETLIQPTNTGSFDSTGARIRNAYSGATPDASKFYFGLTAGVQYRVPLNTSGTLFALPEVFGTYGVTPLVRGMNWRASSIAGGVSFEYRMFEALPPPPPPPPPPPVQPPQPVKAKPPALSARLAVATLDSLQNERPLKELVIEDYIRTQYRPLLNYIFFDSGPARMPERYHALTKSETSTFDYKALNDYETLPLYYELLNIVGERMRMYPHGTLRIVGCSARPAVGTHHASDLTIARGRAETVFHYLRDVWNIDSSRMKIEARGLPEKPSNAQDSDGQAENRRAEIYSNVPQILEPIFTTDTAHIPKPPIIRFLPSGVAEAGWSHWAIPTTEGPSKLKDFSGKGTLTSHIDWELDKEREASLAALDTIRAVLDVTDRTGQEVESNEVSIPVRHYTLLDKHRVGSTDTIISRYSLILFDFDRSDLGNENRRIAEIVKERISGTSDVRILGYTDRMGTDEYNQTLSAQRARSTERYIGIHNADVRGLGRSVLLYNNALPEGRFYSRTVTVVVTTPYGAAGRK